MAAKKPCEGKEAGSEKGRSPKPARVGVEARPKPLPPKVAKAHVPAVAVRAPKPPPVKAAAKAAAKPVAKPLVPPKKPVPTAKIAAAAPKAAPKPMPAPAPIATRRPAPPFSGPAYAASPLARPPGPCGQRRRGRGWLAQPSVGSPQRQAVPRQEGRAVHGQGPARALPDDPAQLEAGLDDGK